MLTVHHLNNSRSQRILWMLEELGAEYAVVRYERDPATMFAPPALLAVHPLGKSPVIDVDGLVIAESGAIVEYLADRFGGLRPSGAAAKRLSTYWLHFAEGSAMLPLVLKLYLGRVGPAAAAVMERVSGQIAAMLAEVEAALAGNPFFAGQDLSVADIMMSYPLEAAVARGQATNFPGIISYLDRIHARPAYLAALERGGPYQLLK
jgi:glutathione S-transferase